jgi:hypothetical protein
MGFLELQAAGDGADHRASAAEAAHQPAERTADAARIALAEDDAGGDDEVGRHHLALADVLAALHLAAGRQRAFLHHVLHADAALHHLEAVGLLDHHADQAHRRVQAVAAQACQDVALRLDHRDRALRGVALLELHAGVLRAAGAGTALCRRASFTEGLRRGDAAAGEGECGQRERSCHDGASRLVVVHRRFWNPPRALSCVKFGG